MAILKHIASKSSNYGAALEYLIFKHDELRKTPILDQNGNRIMRNEFYLDRQPLPQSETADRYHESDPDGVEEPAGYRTRPYL